MNQLKKLIKPIMPEVSDFPKEEGFKTEKLPFIIAYRKYLKEIAKYDLAIIKYNQLKFIKDIKRSTEKLCLKKYFIEKQ